MTPMMSKLISMYIGEMGLPRNFEARFIPVTESGCWLWTGAENGVGYGMFWNPFRKKMECAHRFAYEWIKGDIPKGLHLDHLCRVPCCVNPDHLECVTHRENMLRSDSMSGIYARRTHCKHGHPFSGDNLGKRADHEGSRRCRACHAEHNRVYRLEHRKVLDNSKPAQV